MSQCYVTDDGQCFEAHGSGRECFGPCSLGRGVGRAGLLRGCASYIKCSYAPVGYAFRIRMPDGQVLMRVERTA